MMTPALINAEMTTMSLIYFLVNASEVMNYIKWLKESVHNKSTNWFCVYWIRATLSDVRNPSFNFVGIE